MTDFLETKALFEALLAVISKKRRKYVRSLGQGLSPEEVRSLIKTQPVPDELVAIYACVRGTPWEHEDTELWDLIPGYGLIAIDEINGVIEHLRASWEKFAPDMIPFLRDYSGDYYCVRSLESDRTVVALDHEIGMSVEYQTIDHFILVTTECYKQKVYFVDDGILSCEDISLLTKIVTDTAPTENWL